MQKLRLNKGLFGPLDNVRITAVYSHNIMGDRPKQTFNSPLKRWPDRFNANHHNTYYSSVMSSYVPFSSKSFKLFDIESNGKLSLHSKDKFFSSFENIPSDAKIYIGLVAGDGRCGKSQLPR